VHRRAHRLGATVVVRSLARMQHQYSEERVQNPQGLQLQCYKWEVQQPKALLFGAHGYLVHARFEFLRSEVPGGARDVYEGTWLEAFNKQGWSFYAVDHQSHGRSEGLKPQLRSYFESVEDIVDDFIQVVKHFSQQHPGVPVVLLGQSLGGCIAVRAAEKAPKLATVLIALAPMLSLKGLSRQGCNPILIPVSRLLNMVGPTWPLGTHQKNTKFPTLQQEVDGDPLCYHEKTRVRSGIACLNACKMVQAELHKVECAVITFQSKADTQVDPDSSELLIEKASSSVKRLIWKNNMWHQIMQEPGNEEVLPEVIDFISANLTSEDSVSVPTRPIADAD